MKAVARLAALVLAACSGAGGTKPPPSVPPKPNPVVATEAIDPQACGAYAASGDGRKVQAFLEATIDLRKRVTETAEAVRSSCVLVGAKLGIPDDPARPTRELCEAVFAKDALKARSALAFKYTPGVCTVDVAAAIALATACELDPSSKTDTVAVDKITGSCSGRCTGPCEGTCVRKPDAQGACNDECRGSCRGACHGHADVEASPSCKARASVLGAVEMQCTPPALSISHDGKLAAAATTREALEAGLPELLAVRARLEAIKYAVDAWVVAANEANGSLAILGPRFRDQAACVTNQIKNAFALVGSMEGDLSVALEVTTTAAGIVGG